MKIALISDTHGKADLTKKALLEIEKKDVAHLIHAGDIGSVEILDMMEEFPSPYTAVFGNNDYFLISYQDRYNLFKEPHYFKIGEKNIKLMHLPYYLTPDSDIIIYGHLHKFQAELIKGKLFINPGEICARNKPYSEFAIVEIKESSFIVEYFYRHINEDDWNIKVFEG